MNFLGRYLSRRPVYETLKQPSSARQLTGGFVVGFLWVLIPLLLIGGLISLIVD